MSEDLGLQRAILASLRTAQPARPAPRPAPAPRPGPTITRTTSGARLPTQPMVRPGARPSASGDIRATEPARASSFTAGKASPKKTFSGTRLTGTKEARDSYTSAALPAVESSVQQRIGVGRGVATPTGSSGAIASRSEGTPPGWTEVLKGGGRVQKQNPSGSNIVVDAKAPSFVNVHQDHARFPAADIMLLCTTDATAGGRDVSMVCQVKNTATREEPSAGFGVGFMSADGTTAVLAVLPTSKDARHLSIAPHTVVDDGDVLARGVSMQATVALDPGSGKTDGFTTLAVVASKNSFTIGVNGVRVFKGVPYPGLDPQGAGVRFVLLLHGGKANVKNIAIVQDDALAAKPSNNSNIDRAMAQQIEADILDRSPNVQWDDVAALSEAKRLLNEAVVLPLMIPEFFTGIRTPWKGVLLFGPPGTGKTLLAKAVATCAQTTFFNMSASTLCNRYVGESEKMVKCLFQMARQHSPATVFFDEVDALMTTRGAATEHEFARRLKSELLQQIDGVPGSESDCRVMVLATTNKPWDLDDALRRRLEKRIYIPLPDAEGRKELFRIHTRSLHFDESVDLGQLASQTDGYSGADIHHLCRDAAMMPMRRVICDKSPQDIAQMRSDGQLDPQRLTVTMADFNDALKKIQPSVSPKDLHRYAQWMEEFGST